MKLLIKGIGAGPTFFFASNKIKSYMKALNTIYKPSLTEKKIMFNFLRFCNFYKNYHYKHIDQTFLESIFLEM